MDGNVSVLKLLAIISPALVGDYGEICVRVGWPYLEYFTDTPRYRP